MRSLEGKRTCAAARQTGGAGGSTDSRAKDYLANALVRVVVGTGCPVAQRFLALVSHVEIGPASLLRLSIRLASPVWTRR